MSDQGYSPEIGLRMMSQDMEVYSQNSTDCDPITKGKRIKQSIHESDGTCYQVAGLELQTGAKDQIYPPLSVRCCRNAGRLSSDRVIYEAPWESPRDSHVQPGRMSAIPDCARAEKQKSDPPMTEPNTLAMNDIRIAAVTSKIFEKSWFAGARMRCRRPSKQPMKKAMGRSMKRP